MTDQYLHPTSAFARIPTQDQRRHHQSEWFLHRGLNMLLEFANRLSHLTTD
ncbi:hypothetical protein [Tunturiibacter gelidiferens]|uniref:hypothetical protein n=1 Tax=Tunturiibacter gelidiferens TaxID=3069689 RepID=UPI003D9AE058